MSVLFWLEKLIWTLSSVQKERDLELAARIGQSLLKKNKTLSERNELLEEQVEHIREEVHICHYPFYTTLDSCWNIVMVSMILEQCNIRAMAISIFLCICTHIGVSGASRPVHERWAVTVLHQRSWGKWGGVNHLHTVSLLPYTSPLEEYAVQLYMGNHSFVKKDVRNYV